MRLRQRLHIDALILTLMVVALLVVLTITLGSRSAPDTVPIRERQLTWAALTHYINAMDDQIDLGVNVEVWEDRKAELLPLQEKWNS